jgi:hypothetical protein
MAKAKTSKKFEIPADGEGIRFSLSPASSQDPNLHVGSADGQTFTKVEVIANVCSIEYVNSGKHKGYWKIAFNQPRELSTKDTSVAIAYNDGGISREPSDCIYTQDKTDKTFMLGQFRPMETGESFVAYLVQNGGKKYYSTKKVTIL